MLHTGTVVGSGGVQHEHQLLNKDVERRWPAVEAIGYACSFCDSPGMYSTTLDDDEEGAIVEVFFFWLWSGQYLK
jgi:hypothetical protein